MAKSPRPFNYDAHAVLEARAAYQWYAESSLQVAQRFIFELERARRLVTQSPETWSPYLHGTRCLRLRRFPYGLVYIVGREDIRAVAVCHLHRRAGYWRDRL